MKSYRMQRVIMHVHTSPRSGDATLTPGELERLAAETGRDIKLLGSVEVAHRDAHLIVVGIHVELNSGSSDDDSGQGKPPVH